MGEKKGNKLRRGGSIVEESKHTKLQISMLKK